MSNTPASRSSSPEISRRLSVFLRDRGFAVAADREVALFAGALPAGALRAVDEMPDRVARERVDVDRPEERSEDLDAERVVLPV